MIALIGVLMSCMPVLLHGANPHAWRAGDGSMLDGSNLGTQMEVITLVITRVYDLTKPLSNRKEEKLLKSVRCAAEVLLQTAPRLLVRVLRYRAGIWVAA